MADVGNLTDTRGDFKRLNCQGHAGIVVYGELPFQDVCSQCFWPTHHQDIRPGQKIVKEKPTEAMVQKEKENTSVWEQHKDDPGVALEVLAGQVHCHLHALPWEVAVAVMEDNLRQGSWVGSSQPALVQLNEQLADERLQAGIHSKGAFQNPAVTGLIS